MVTPVDCIMKMRNSKQLKRKKIEVKRLELATSTTLGDKI